MIDSGLTIEYNSPVLVSLLVLGSFDDLAVPGAYGRVGQGRCLICDRRGSVCLP